MSGQGGCHLRWSKCFFSFSNLDFDFATGALWMPLGNLDRALRTDFPVHQRPHTFSLPTIYKVQIIFFYGFNTLLKWKKVAKRELNGRRLQEVKLSDCFQWTLFILLKCFPILFQKFPCLSVKESCHEK